MLFKGELAFVLLFAYLNLVLISAKNKADAVHVTAKLLKEFSLIINMSHSVIFNDEELKTYYSSLVATDKEKTIPSSKSLVSKVLIDSLDTFKSQSSMSNSLKEIIISNFKHYSYILLTQFNNEAHLSNNFKLLFRTEIHEKVK